MMMKPPHCHSSVIQNTHSVNKGGKRRTVDSGRASVSRRGAHVPAADRLDQLLEFLSSPTLRDGRVTDPLEHKKQMESTKPRHQLYGTMMKHLEDCAERMQLQERNEAVGEQFGKLHGMSSEQSGLKALMQRALREVGSPSSTIACSLSPSTPPVQNNLENSNKKNNRQKNENSFNMIAGNEEKMEDNELFILALFGSALCQLIRQYCAQCTTFRCTEADAEAVTKALWSCLETYDALCGLVHPSRALVVDPDPEKSELEAPEAETREVRMKDSLGWVTIAILPWLEYTIRAKSTPLMKHGEKVQQSKRKNHEIRLPDSSATSTSSQMRTDTFAARMVWMQNTLLFPCIHTMARRQERERAGKSVTSDHLSTRSLLLYLKKMVMTSEHVHALEKTLHTERHPTQPLSLKTVEGVEPALKDDEIALVLLLMCSAQLSQLVEGWHRYARCTAVRGTKWSSRNDREHHAAFLQSVVGHIESMGRHILSRASVSLHQSTREGKKPNSGGDDGRSPALMYHRTIHTGLNGRLEALWRGRENVTHAGPHYCPRAPPQTTISSSAIGTHDHRIDSEPGEVHLDRANGMTSPLNTPLSHESPSRHWNVWGKEMMPWVYHMVLHSLTTCLREMQSIYFSTPSPLPSHVCHPRPSFGTSKQLAMRIFSRLVRVCLDLELHVSFELYYLLGVPSRSDVDIVAGFMRSGTSEDEVKAALTRATATLSSRQGANISIANTVDSGETERKGMAEKSISHPPPVSAGIGYLFHPCLELRAAICEFVYHAIQVWSATSGDSEMKFQSQTSRDSVERMTSTIGQQQASREKNIQWIHEEFIRPFSLTFQALLRRHYMFSTEEVAFAVAGCSSSDGCCNCHYPFSHTRASVDDGASAVGTPVVKSSSSLQQLPQATSTFDIRFALQETTRLVFQYWLLTHLQLRDWSLLKDASAGPPDTDASGQKNGDSASSLSSARIGGNVSTTSYFTACGVGLSQALEVAFLLAMYAAKWPSQQALGAAALISPRAVHSYIQEVFFTLEHSTAKQLWHLRSTGVLFYFTGEQKKGRQYLPEGSTVRRRHAQSVLSVVHAHVCHPSLLWMPLYQLQEMVTILSLVPDVLFRPVDDDNMGEEDHTDADVLEATTAKEDEFDGVLPVPTPLEPVDKDMTGMRIEEDFLEDNEDVGEEDGELTRRRVKVLVGRQQSDLSLFHGYMVLRLFVVSNILRQWRRDLLYQLKAPLSHVHEDQHVVPPHNNATAPAQSLRRSHFQREHLVKELERLQQLEPKSEEHKSQHARQWAKEAVSDIMQDPALFALAGYMEDSPDPLWGAVRSVQRLERTIQVAVKHRLLMNVTAESKKRFSRRTSAHLPSLPTHKSSDESSIAGREESAAGGKTLNACGPPDHYAGTQGEGMIDANLGTTEGGKENQNNHLNEISLHIQRDHSQAPMGFVLSLHHAEVRQVTPLVSLKRSENESQEEGRKANATVGSKNQSFNADFVRSLSKDFPEDESPKATSCCSPFALAAAASGIKKPEALIGWRVVSIDGVRVSSGKDVAAQVKGKTQFIMKLSVSDSMHR